MSLALNHPKPAVSAAGVLVRYGRALMSGDRVQDAVDTMNHAARLAAASGDALSADEARDWLATVRRILKQHGHVG